MGSILFFDPTCTRPYDSATLRRQAMGGTEASVVRIADALDALVAQHNRTERSGRDPGVGCVVVLRDSRALSAVRDLYPSALGTPVLAGLPARIAAGFGLFDDYLERIRRAWRSGQRPVTAADSRFRLSAIAQRWRAVLA